MRFRPSAWRMSAAHPSRTRSPASSSRRSGRASPTATGSRSSAGSRRRSPSGGYGSRGPWDSRPGATEVRIVDADERESARCSSAGRRSSVTRGRTPMSPSRRDRRRGLARDGRSRLPRRGRRPVPRRPQEGDDHPRRLQRLPARGRGRPLCAPGGRSRLRWSACPHELLGEDVAAFVVLRPGRARLARGASGVDEGARRGLQVRATRCSGASRPSTARASRRW